MLLGTSLVDSLCVLMTFQSPERIHAFGNQAYRRHAMPSQRFNPQRGFMLLGTSHKNRQITALRQVSIPREDSCFWEHGGNYCPRVSDWFQSPERIHAFGNLAGDFLISEI